jgi:hypothetical protein
MTPADWLAILAATRTALADPSCDGVVILPAPTPSKRPPGSCT